MPSNLDAYKVNLDTPQPEGRLGESPRAAFTKYNALIDVLESRPTAPGTTTVNNLAQWADTTGTALKNGPALVANKYDETPGSVLTVDYAGIGGSGTSNSAAARDYAESYSRGMWFVNDTAANRPNNQNGLLVGGGMGSGGGAIFFPLDSSATTRAWISHRQGSTWRPFVELFHTGKVIPIANGGTNATTATQARTNLGLGAAATAGIYSGGSAPGASDVMSSAPSSIELNHAGSGNRAAFIDFHSKDGTDYDARIIKNTGNGGFALMASNGSVLNTLSLEANQREVQLNYGSNAGVRIYTYAPSSGTTGMIRVDANGSPAGSGYLEFNYNGNLIGSVTVATASTVNYNTSSDYRLKTNVKPLTGALSRVLAALPVTYDWIPDGMPGEGFLAHQLAEVVPLAVTGDKDEMHDDGTPKHQQVDLSKAVPLLFAAIQELYALLPDTHPDP